MRNKQEFDNEWGGGAMTRRMSITNRRIKIRTEGRR